MSGPTLLLKPGEVAEQLRLPRARVNPLIAEGQIPSIRVGNDIRVATDALLAWIAKKATE